MSDRNEYAGAEVCRDLGDTYYRCHDCGKITPWAKGKCIDCLLDAVPWREGDTVRIKSSGKVGTVAYRYYNGYTMVDTGERCTGGVFNNDCAWANDELELVQAEAPCSRITNAFEMAKLVGRPGNVIKFRIAISDLLRQLAGGMSTGASGKKMSEEQLRWLLACDLAVARRYLIPRDRKSCLFQCRGKTSRRQSLARPGTQPLACTADTDTPGRCDHPCPPIQSIEARDHNQDTNTQEIQP